MLLTSTETVRTITDGDPRTSTSTFTQLLSTEPNRLLLEMSIIIIYRAHRDHKYY